MNRIMVVDDESLIREWLVMCLVSSGISKNKIDEAKNGEEALILQESNIYDCIFTDITMPKLDGMELIKQIRLIDDSVKIVILTCHDDFIFARNAVKYNVSEYFLKNELSKEDIEIIVKKIYINDSCEIEKNKKVEYLCKILYEDYNVTSTDLEKLNIRINNSYFAISIQNRRIDNNHIKLLNSKNTNVIEAFYDGASKTIIIIEIIDRRVSYIEILKFLKQRVAQLYGDTIFGESKVYSKQEDLGKCIKEAVLSWEIQFFELTEYDLKNYINRNIADIIYNYKSYIKSMGESIISQYSISGKDFVFNNINEIYAYFIDNEIWDSDFLKRIMLNIIEGIEIKAEIGSEIVKSYLSKILNANKWGDVEKTVSMFLNEINDVDICSESIKAAKKYINLHYNESITLTDLANHACLSEEYFSRLFKKEVGKNYTEYLADIRMEKAKVLLKEGMFSINEVAEMVGINNQSYFSSLFKKYYGISPSSVKNT